MRVLYNEGRVVGLSSYELYVRQLLSDDPNAVPMSEREWLCSTIAKGNSMILHVPSGTPAGYNDFPLPEGSDLCGCATMDASLFLGDVDLEKTDTWAINVKSYGRLIANNDESCPVTPGQPANVPIDLNYDELSADMKVIEYTKITSAIMIQPGEWVGSVVDTEWQNEERQDIQNEVDDDILVGYISGGYKALNPDLTKNGFIRLYMTDEIEEDLLILIRGFFPKHIITGYLGFDSHEDISQYINGSFLGPQLFPWACKIVLVSETNMASATLSMVSSSLDVIYQFVDNFIDNLTATQVKFNNSSLTITSTDVQGAVSETWNDLKTFESHFVVMTEAEYSQLATKDPDTFYFLKES